MKTNTPQCVARVAETRNTQKNLERKPFKNCYFELREGNKEILLKWITYVGCTEVKWIQLILYRVQLRY